MPVPAQSFIVVPVEEVHFTTGRPDIGMEANEFQKCPRSALLHANYKSTRKPAIARGRRRLSFFHLAGRILVQFIGTCPGSVCGDVRLVADNYRLVIRISIDCGRMWIGWCDEYPANEKIPAPLQLIGETRAGRVATVDEEDDQQGDYDSAVVQQRGGQLWTVIS